MKALKEFVSWAGTPPNGLPQYWQEATSADGVRYYWCAAAATRALPLPRPHSTAPRRLVRRNTLSRAVTYDKPPRLPEGWYEAKDPQTSVLYFFNYWTRETRPYHMPPNGMYYPQPRGAAPVGPPPGEPPDGSPSGNRPPAVHGRSSEDEGASDVPPLPPTPAGQTRESQVPKHRQHGSI